MTTAAACRERATPPRSELQLVGVHLRGKREAGLQVRLGVGAEGLDDGVVRLLLAGLAVRGDALLLGLLGEELVLLGLLGGLLPGEEGVAHAREVGALEIHLGAGADAEALIDPPQGHAVHGVGAGDEQEAALQLLQEDHTAATEAAREEDEDGARHDVLLQLRALRLGLLGVLHLLGGALALLAEGLEDLTGLACLAHGAGGKEEERVWGG